MINGRIIRNDGIISIEVYDKFVDGKVLKAISKFCPESGEVEFTADKIKHLRDKFSFTLNITDGDKETNYIVCGEGR